MFDETGTPETAPRSDGGETPIRGFRPRLTFYHANAKGSGSAARFEITPAGRERDGAVYLTLAQQKSVASGSAEQGTRQHATFDWTNRITVKLNFSDLCQIVPVLKGVSATLTEGKGLYHESRNTVTRINLARQAEPYAGWALDVSRKGRAEADAASRVRIVFNPAEAFGLGAVLEQALGLIVFGVPAEPYPVAGAVSRAEPEPTVF